MTAHFNDVIISLGISDRRRAMEFYLAAFEFELLGTPASDGVPEPLQFQLNDNTRIMFVPRDGFDWVLARHTIAPPGVNEAILGLGEQDPDQVDQRIERIIAAGGRVVTAAAEQPWGYTALCADPDGHLWQITAVSPQPTS